MDMVYFEVRKRAPMSKIFFNLKKRKLGDRERKPSNLWQGSNFQVSIAFFLGAIYDG
jgi:hypothetical protein